MPNTKQTNVERLCESGSYPWRDERRIESDWRKVNTTCLVSRSAVGCWRQINRLWTTCCASCPSTSWSSPVNASDVCSPSSRIHRANCGQSRSVCMLSSARHLLDPGTGALSVFSSRFRENAKLIRLFPKRLNDCYYYTVNPNRVATSSRFRKACFRNTQKRPRSTLNLRNHVAECDL